jgi:DNA-binding beta-propeller fold protein YncE
MRGADIAPRSLLRTTQLRIALSIVSLALASSSLVQAQQPLRLVQTIEMPEVPAGPYTDHLALDLKGNRLFTTMQAAHAVDVLDLTHGAEAKSINGLGNPHAIFFDPLANTLFVTDSEHGVLHVLDGTSYLEIKSIQLERGADGIVFDGRTGLLYVSNGGDEAGQTFSLISVVDVRRQEKIADIRIDSAGLEAMAIEPSTNRLFVNLPVKNSIAVVNLTTRQAVATWHLTKGRKNMAIALDPIRHLLFVGCRDTNVRGSIVVIDTQTSRESARIPIGGWVDSLFFDPASLRIYASCGVGEVFTLTRQSNGQYRKLPDTDTAVMAKTALYSPESQHLYVAVPHLGDTPAQVMAFEAR